MTAESHPVRYYINSWSARATQRLAARVVDSLVAVAWVAAVIVIGPHGRPVAQNLVIIAGVAAIEAISISRTGATLGMRLVGIRVATVGHAGHPDFLTAWRRSIPVALCYPLLSPGFLLVAVMPFALLFSIGFSPLRRGFHDRLSGTVVVQHDAPNSITDGDLATWWEPDQRIVMTRWGRVPDLDDRRRARASRLDGAWWLAAVVMVLTIVSVGMRDLPLLWLWSTTVWVVVAAIDEYWWISTRGATPGHARHGYRVVDIHTGEPPGPWRAALRAGLTSVLVYVPPLQLLLAVWVRASAQNRGPHDLIARTVVVEPDHVVHAFAAPPVPVYPSLPTWSGWSPVSAQPGWGQGPWTPPPVPLPPQPAWFPPPPPPPPPHPAPGPF